MSLRILDERNEAPAYEQVDLLIGAIGFETRSTWLIEQTSMKPDQIIGLRFHHSEELHFPAALEMYESKHAHVISFPSEDHVATLAAEFAPICADLPHEVSVVVDISAMSRVMIAATFLALRSALASRSLHLFVHYTPAKFISPPELTGVTIAQPIMRELAGWSSRPDSPVAALVGLGFENGSALGALQFVEPTRAWLFEPDGFDRRFLPEVRKANEHIGSVFEARTLPYRVDRPVETRAMIGSLMRDLCPTHRIIFIPFGPKIFSWLCILSAIEDKSGESSVWRFSAQGQARPVDYEASGFSVWHHLTLSQNSSAT